MTPRTHIIGALCRLFLIFCIFVPSLTSALERPDRLSLQSLLQSEKYADLERELSSYQTAYENRKTSDTVVSQAFGSFGNSAPWLEKRLNTWLSKYPNSYSAYMARGAYYNHLGWLSRGGRYTHKTSKEQFKDMHSYFINAARDFNSALNLNPKLTVAYDYLIGIDSATKKTSLKKELFRKAMQIDVASFVVRSRYLWTLQPKWGGSVEVIKEFLKESEKYVSQNKELKVLPGYLEYFLADSARKGSRNLARELYSRSLKYGNYWWFKYQRGKNSYFERDYQNALQDFTAVLKKHPNYVGALKHRGWTLLKLKQPTEALRDFNLALRLDAMEPHALRGRGKIFLKRKEYYSALADFDNALVYGAHKSQNWFLRGKAHLYGMKNYQKAASDLKQALKVSPKKRVYWYHYGVAQHYTGDCDIVNSLNVYINLCELKGGCKKKRVRWAKNTVNIISQTRTLQARGKGSTKRCL